MDVDGIAFHHSQIGITTGLWAVLNDNYFLYAFLNMILRRQYLGTKELRRAIGGAPALLNRLAKLGGYPKPMYDFEPHKKRKKRSYHYCMHFRIPNFILKDCHKTFFNNKVIGSGRDKHNFFAKNLCALEVIRRIEQGLDLSQGTLEERIQKRSISMKLSPDIPDQMIHYPPMVSWEITPVDNQFEQIAPAGREGAIDFSTTLLHNEKAWVAAKAYTLSAHGHLPQVIFHEVNNLEKDVKQRWAEIISNGDLPNIMGPNDERSENIDKNIAETLALESAYDGLNDDTIVLCKSFPPSFGMARLFTKLPESIFVKIQELVNQIETTPALLMAEYEEEDQPPPPPIEYLIDDPLPTLVDFDDNKTCENVLKTDSLPENNCSTVENMEDSPFETHGVDTSESHRYDTDSRLKVFQESRKEFPLPIDDINVPSEASVTIIRGGFGSGKSLRYPSMLSLLSKDDTNIVVVHPVAIFCEVTAQRVASEQGLEIGAPGCPIGFGSKSLMLSESRRISFVTPLEILSKCMEDSLLMENVTHLIIDEVQERTADMDMVVAMSKHIMRERAKHEMLPPFRVTLLSTFTDTSLLEACFAKDGHAITVIDSPEAESHPIQVFHLNNTEEDEFPESIQAKRLRGHHGHDREVLADYDEALCIAASKVVTQSLLRDDIFDGGSILVFLPGVQEIRLTARLLYGKFRKIEAKGRYNGQIPPTLFLHPNIDAEELQQCFQPCPKIILATDIAESIISIPDCRVVIDVGRQRNLATMHKSAFSVDEANVGVLLTTTNISKSSAEKRLNQVSRYAPGKCYRLFFQRELKKFDDVKKSDLEILDLSTLLLHLLALENSGTMLSFLQDLPSPPDPDELEETLGSLSRDGLIEYNPDDRENTCLTPLGRVVGTFPVPNRVGRMLMMGLVLRAIDSALTVASLLAVPEVFTTNRKAKFPSNQYYSVYTSDVVRAMEAFFAYVEKDSRTRRTDPYSIDYQKCMLMKEQLEGLVKNLLKNTGANDVEADWATWNANDDRLAALAGLLCVSTPRVAHLVSRSHLVTNDYQGTARIHPNSVNAGPQRRAHWYLYNESKPSPDSNIYLDVTTAVSPVELALFSEGKPLETMCDKDDKTNAFQQLIHKDNVIFLADGWIPVSFMDPAQLHVLKKLRNLLRGDMLQQVVQDPHSLMTDPLHEQLIICVLDAIEHHRKANP